MKSTSFLVALIFCGLISFSHLLEAAQTKGVSRVPIKTQQGQEIGFYSGSYALLIGVSDYTAGWPDIESIPGELKAVEGTLEANGFHVTKVLNPNSRQLEEAFRNFTDQYGYDNNNRLLFFYSGHGYSRNQGTKGYLIPADAPDPRKDLKNFLRKSLDMTQIHAWSRQMVAKHALFLFDSCFSGAIFRTKALPKHPPHITQFTANPVRQYITAGSAGEEVPANSVFTPSFVRALRGEGDLNKDGYVTGTEMGMYLNEKVLYYQTGQTPQYGKLRDPNLDQGDFVFQLQGSVPQAKIPQKPDAEKEMWALIENTKAIGDIEDFLKAFPGGQYAAVANLKLKQLKREKLVWEKKLDAMIDAFARVQDSEKQRKNPSYNLNNWQWWLRNFQENNPSSTEDERMRNIAKQRITFWQTEKQRLAKLEEKQQIKVAWKDKLETMKAAFAWAQQFEKGKEVPSLKLKEWQQWLRNFEADNPYSQEDDQMRRSARERIVYWQEGKRQQGRIDLLTQITTALQNHFGKDTRAGRLVEKYVSLYGENHLFQELRVDPQSQYNLGSIYRKGYGTRADNTKAVFWFRKAALQGYAKAQTQLGFMLRKGYGIAQDSSQAVYWYEQAANQGNLQAHFNLGGMYLKGYGVPKDRDRAVQFFRKAANQGHKGAQHVLKILKEEP